MIHQSGLRPGEADRVLAGDALLPDAAIVIDRANTLPAPPEAVWPWLVQLGKDRAGWYFPRAVERFIPPTRRGLWRVEPSYQDLALGDEIPDWGPGDPTFSTMVVDPPHTIAYRSERGKAVVTWVLHLSPDGDADSRLHVRLKIDRRHDWLTPVIADLGGLFDWLTIIGLFAGLKERLATS